ncbi:MAG: sel1 repeat family protein [Ectothiorhodospiraceae bacterium]|nr:sel1 repeat family protein [Ectothiorhodospiraceae bacterium]MCH8504188.1 sel1 repeat family protein [Ectothiorhodospiraceae bacterium]
MLACRALSLAVMLMTAPLFAENLPRWADADPDAYSVNELVAHGQSYLRERDEPEEAYSWYLAAARQGSSVGSANLGWLYENGHGVEQDGAQAVHWYTQAVHGGAIRYSLHLAWLHMDDRLVERDRQIAEQWFRFGITHGMAEAKLALGSVYYADVLGGNIELGPKAEALLRDALEEGMLYATRFLARMYLDGTGVERDRERGLSAVKLGAGAGDSHLQLLLSQLYLEGRLIEENPVQANVWATLAAAQGEDQGERIRQYLEQQVLSEAEVRESRQQAVRLAAGQQ